MATLSNNSCLNARLYNNKRMLGYWIDAYIGAFKAFNIVGDIMDEICFLKFIQHCE